MAGTRFRIICAAALVLCSNALAAVHDAACLARDAFSRLGTYLLRAVDPRPLIYRDPSDLDQHQLAHVYGDPHVVRHEAGMATLAAARGI